MTEHSPSVAGGSLGGINLPGEDLDAPDVDLPPDADFDEPQAATPVAEPQTDTASDGGHEPPSPPPALPGTEEEPPKARRRRAAPGEPTLTPARLYVVLREEVFEDSDEAYYVKVHEVEARNAQNAMRQAFRDLVEGESGEATLVVIPASMFKPTPVKISKTEKVSVSFS